MKRIRIDRKISSVTFIVSGKCDCRILIIPIRIFFTGLFSSNTPDLNEVDISF